MMQRMPPEFDRSLRALNRDGSGRSIAGIAVAALLLGLWLAWFLTVPVARYEVTDRARVEVDQSVHVIQAAVPGRVVRSGLALGREVKAGETLVEIETVRGTPFADTMYGAIDPIRFDGGDGNDVLLGSDGDDNS
jgi:multidrug efflux pump subunit AcrA (membrane-fusion protein)